MKETPLLGRLLWYELLTTDVKKAEAFYTDVVGWTVTPFEAATNGYEMWVKPDGKPMGGVMTLPSGMNVPPHWVMYIGASELEAAVATVETLGGSSLSPVIEIPTVGRMRAMRDPQGAMFALFEPSPRDGTPETEPAVGDVSWHELLTTDSDAAMRFYSEAFGWTEMATHDMGPMGVYRMFGRAFMFGGMMTKGDEMAKEPTAWGIYFRVPDIQSAVARVKAGGGQLLNGPMEVPGGSQVAQCLDPQGAYFALHQPAA